MQSSRGSMLLCSNHASNFFQLSKESRNTGALIRLTGHFDQIQQRFDADPHSAKQRKALVDQCAYLPRVNRTDFLSCNFFSKYFNSSSVKQWSMSLRTRRICLPVLILDRWITLENDASKPSCSRISRWVAVAMINSLRPFGGERLNNSFNVCKTLFE